MRGRTLLAIPALGVLAILLTAPADGQIASSGGPNLILDVSASLINSVVRQKVDRVQDVSDVVQGTPVSGISRTIGSVHAELAFDPDRAAIDIVTEGTAYSQT